MTFTIYLTIGTAVVLGLSFMLLMKSVDKKLATVKIKSKRK